MDYFYIIIPSLFLLLLFTFILFLHLRKKKAIKNVVSLTPAKKDALLDTLADTIGYSYDHKQDLFVARKDALQRIFGYTTLFDLSAPYFNMIFDYETIYFNYSQRTWLIEMWKGQYGINTGCELGIYYADKIVSPNEYATTHFKSVSDKDMLFTSLSLNRRSSKNQILPEKVGTQQGRHWWMTLFKLGTYTKPENLFVNTSIVFKDYYMMYHFINSFEKTLPQQPYRIDNLTVSFTFQKSNRKYSLFKRFVRKVALTFCFLYCKLFNCLTRPFKSSGNKILYLYYYMPFMIRLMFRTNNKNLPNQKGGSL